ncbi:retrotransposon protein, putative, ty1-copia subclass [Tanacetum coccineum]|uniref:Retrotransposon protein, putative, ty1-copia subclass n=1 Tax=Tanacetum coccineum TaxID=301880 RepID=A0ABQ5H5L6_9ASTR
MQQLVYPPHVCKHGKFGLVPYGLGIAPAAIIDRQLPFEYTITSRSTDVVVMAQPVQNINHSAFRSMFEREKLSGNNFNDWFRQLKLVLRVEKKMFVIEQPLPAAPAADSDAQVLSQWNAIYDAYNEVACLILGSMTPELHRQFENSSPYDMIKELKAMFEKQAGVERFDLIQTFHACKQEEGKPVAAYVIWWVGLIKDFAGFMRNYNMHNTRKTIGELHAMLIEYEKGKGKANANGKDKQVYISKPKNPKPTAKEHPTKDDTYHHCKEVGHWKWNCPVYLAELLKKKKQVSTASSSDVSRQGASYFITFTDDYSCYGYVYLLKHKHEVFETFKVFKNEVENQLRKTIKALRSDRGLGIEALVKQISPDRTPTKIRMLFEKNLITQEVSGRAIDLEEIQDEDTSPFEITSEIPMEVKGFEPPQEEEILICRSERSRRVPNRLCLNVEAEEHNLGDLNEHTSYKAAMLDPESNKWLDAMNAEMQSMIDNMVWVLVDLPPNFKTVRSK